MSGNVRASAVKILCLTEAGGFADALLDSTILRERFVMPGDSALLTEIVMGTLRHRLILDRIISKYIRRDLEKTDNFVRNAMRVGAYQVLFLSRVPPHAAVFETVEIVKKGRGESLAGFTNGVLRSLLRDLEEGDVEEMRGTFPLHVRYSVPSWMAGELERYFQGNRLELVLKRFSSTPPTHVRINRVMGDNEMVFSALREEGVEFSPHPAADDCLVLHAPPPLHDFRPVRDGLVTPQDAGAVFVSQVVAGVGRETREEGGRLLDACSAPGIKTSHLVALLPGWRVWATDVSKKRVERMKRNFERMGVRDVTTGLVDFTGTVPSELVEAFDIVFVDAPCTGLGVMRRNPEVKWRVKRGDADVCADKSRRILHNALSCVKKGGFCVYSTCTFTERENEGVVKSISQTRGCMVESFKTLLPRIPDELVRDGSLITAPDLLDSDFFYLALLKK